MATVKQKVVGRTLANNEKMRLMMANRRTVQPLIVAGVEHGRSMVIQPVDFKKLNVDERYQRIRLTHVVNELIHVIRSGGAILDPVSIAERPDGSWWIMDGQQRFWAHSECEVPIRAMIYRFKDFEVEKAAFLSLNRMRALSPNTKIKAWPGETGATIQEWNAKPGSPFHERIDFGNQTHKPYPASTLARGIAAVVGPQSMCFGRVDDVLSKTDRALDNSGVRERVDAFLRLLPLIFPDNSRTLMLPVVALGRVAQKRWAASVKGNFPDPSIVGKLRRVNWHAAVPSGAQRFLPILEGIIEQRWR